MAQGGPEDFRNLDAEIMKLQKSTRTTVPAMLPLHDVLRNKFRWYYNWHLLPGVKAIHTFVLLLFLFFVGTVFYQFFFSQPNLAFAATTNVLPNGDAIRGWTTYISGCTTTTHYDCVDDAVGAPDDGVSFIGTNTNFTTEFFSHGAGSYAEHIISVKLKYRAGAETSGAYITPGLRIGGTIYPDSTEDYISNLWADFEGVWGEQNPATLQGWTSSDVDSLTFGVTANASADKKPYLTQAYLEVTQVPNAPTVGAATGLSTTSIRWTWTDMSLIESGFRVEDASDAVKCSSASSPCDEGSLAVNNQYTRHINAWDAAGESIDSADVSKYTLANTPGAPTVNTPTTSSIKIIVSQNGNPAGPAPADDTDYAVYNSTLAKWIDPADGVADQAAAVWAPYSSGATNWGGASGKINGSLTSNTQYCYRVRARNGDNVETADTSPDVCNTTLAAIPAAPTAAYVDGATINADGTAISMVVHWIDNANNEAGFHLERQAKCQGSWTDLSGSLVIGPNANSATDTQALGLAQNTSYCWRVHAYNGDGDSGYSNTARGDTLAHKLKPSAALDTATTFRMQGTTTQMTADHADGNAAATISSAGANASYINDDGKVVTVENSDKGRIEKVSTSSIAQNPGGAVRIEESRKNVVLNSSFETYTGTIDDANTDLFDSWGYTGTVAGYAVSDSLHGGTAIKAKVIAGGDYYLTTIFHDEGGAVGGRTFTLSVWAKANTTTSVGANLFAQSLTPGGLAGCGGAVTLNLTTSWQRFTNTVTCAAGDTNTTLRFIVRPDPNQANTVWFDAAQLEEGAFATSYIPTAAVSATRNAERLDYASASNISANAGTVSFWYKPEFSSSSTANTRPFVWAPHAGGIAGGLALGWDGSGNFRIWIYNGSWQSAYKATTFSANTWIHLQGTWDKTSGAQIYVNGVAGTAYSSSWNPGSLPAMFTIGESGDGNVLYANGLLSDFTIFNTALSVSQVRAVYSGYGPTITGGTADSNSQITWSITNNDSNGTGTNYQRKQTTDCTNMSSPSAATNPDTGLSTALAYCFQTQRTLTGGASSLYNISPSPVYTKPNIPGVAVVSNAGGDPVTISNILVNATTQNSNPVDVKYAIQNTSVSGNSWLKSSDGTLQAVPDWQLYSVWNNGAAGKNNIDLSSNTTYSYKVQAQTADSGSTSVLGPASSVTTYANTPGQATASLVAGTASDRLQLALNQNGNPTGGINPDGSTSNDTAYAITCDGGVNFVQDPVGGAAACSGLAKWHTYAEWGSGGGITITGLNVNSSYQFQTKAQPGGVAGGTDLSTVSIAKFTRAAIPNIPTLSAQSWSLANGNSLLVTLSAGTNPANTEFAIACDQVGTSWINASDNSCGAIADDANHWKTKAGWENGVNNLLKNLPADTEYSVSSKGRNGDKVETDLNVAGPIVVTAPAQVALMNLETYAPGDEITANSITWHWVANGIAPTGYRALKDIDESLICETALISCTEGSLNANTSYGIKVQAYRGGVTGQPSAMKSAYTAIEPVSAVNITSTTDNSMTIAPANTPSSLGLGGSGIQYCNTTKGECSGWQQNTDPWESSGLDFKNSYTLTIQSRNGDSRATPVATLITTQKSGMPSPAPAPPAPSDTEAPSAPANLRATGLAATTVSIAWDASDDNVGVAGYQVYNSDTGILVASITSTHENFENLTPETTYRFYVRAYDEAGNYSLFSPVLEITTLKISGGGTQSTTAFLIMSNVPDEVITNQRFKGVKVTAADEGGRIVTNYSQSIFFSSTDKNAELPYIAGKSYVFTPEDEGTHEFALDEFILRSTGVQTLTVSDSLLSSSKNITVRSGASTSIEETASKVRDFFGNPKNATRVNTGVVATSAAVLLAPIILNSIVSASSILPQLLYWFLQVLQMIGIRRRAKPWGVVYNSQTGQPISLAIVKIFEKQYNRMVEQTVTDNQGRYGFLAKPGEFYMKITKAGFSFPPKDKNSSFYEKVYAGGPLKIAENNQSVAFNIPLDPIIKARFSATLFVWLIRINKYLQKARLPLLILGVIFAGVMTVVAYNIVYVLSLMFYVLVMALEGLRIRKARPYGTVTDAFGHPLDLAIVRIYQKNTNRLIETDVSDSQGRFKFLVNPGIYYITAAKGGYLDYKSHLMYLEKEKTLVSSTIKLKKVE